MHQVRMAAAGRRRRRRGRKRRREGVWVVSGTDLWEARRVGVQVWLESVHVTRYARRVVPALDAVVAGLHIVNVP